MVEPLTVKISCDPAAGGVKTSVFGDVPGPLSLKPVIVSFQRSAYTVTPRGMVSVPGFPQPYEVRTLTTRFSKIAVNGYAYANDPATLYHWERATATVKDTSGRVVASANTICRHDTRTILTLTCDPVALTVTGVVSGRGDKPSNTAPMMGAPVRVVYSSLGRSEPVGNDPVFVPLIPDEFPRSVTRSADGSWAGAGFVRQLRGPLTSRYTERTSAVVYDHVGQEVGRGTATCSMP